MANSLPALVAYVSRWVPRYRSIGSFDQFPVTNKWEIMGDLPGHLSDEFEAIKPKLLEFIRDESTIVPDQHESAFSNTILVEETSGSSGVPFRIPKTIGERVQGAVGIWQYRRQIDPALSVDKFYPFVHEPIGFQRKHNPFAFTTANIDRLYQDLTNDGIRWVHGTPEVLVGHAHALSAEAAARQGVRFVENTGYHLTDEARRDIETRLPVTVVDQYGCREVWAMGFRVGGGPFRVISDNVLVEIVDLDGVPVLEPRQSGRIVVSSLYQRLLPFVRYDTGDIGEWADEPIGRHLLLAKDRRIHMMKIGLMEVSGNAIFKKMLLLIYRELGQIAIRYIQIRQLSLSCFALVTNELPEAETLRSALERGCNETKRFPYRVVFVSRRLTEAEVDLELSKKPSLFTSQPMLDKRDSFDL